MKISLDPAAVTRYLLLILGLLVFLHIVGLGFRGVFGKDVVEGYTRYVNFAAERNLPTLFTVVVMLMNAGGTLFIGLEDRKNRSQLAVFWIVLSAILMFLAIDEFGSVHEAISNKLQKAYEFTGIFHWAWVVPYSVFVVVFVATFSRFLWRLPRPTATRFVVAGAVYVCGALILEMVESAIWAAEQRESMRPVMLILITLEESMEMLGQILFLRAVLMYVRDHMDSTITIEMRP